MPSESLADSEDQQWKAWACIPGKKALTKVAFKTSDEVKHPVRIYFSLTLAGCAGTYRFLITLANVTELAFCYKWSERRTYWQCLFF